jgi:hypothetical protein
MEEVRHFLSAPERQGAHCHFLSLEDGPRLGLHLHVLVQVRTGLAQAVRDRIKAGVQRRLKARSLKLPYRGIRWEGRYGRSNVGSAEGWLAYLLKTLVPAGEEIEGIEGCGRGRLAGRVFTHSPLHAVSRPPRSKQRTDNGALGETNTSQAVRGWKKRRLQVELSGLPAAPKETRGMARTRHEQNGAVHRALPTMKVAEMATKLKKLRVREVSLVGRPTNTRRSC